MMFRRYTIVELFEAVLILALTIHGPAVQALAVSNSSNVGPVLFGVVGMAEKKKCTRCGKSRPIKLFGANKARADGKSGWCKICRKEYYEANKEYAQEYARDYARNNPNYKKVRAKYRASDKGKKMIGAYRDKLYNTPEGIEKIRLWKRRTSLKRLYGITLEEYATMYEAQKGACRICGEIYDRLDVDHDHRTKKIRGLLCRKCNVMLGHVYEDIGILENAIGYLRKHKAVSKRGNK